MTSPLRDSLQPSRYIREIEREPYAIPQPVDPPTLVTFLAWVVGFAFVLMALAVGLITYAAAVQR